MAVIIPMAAAARHKDRDPARPEPETIAPAVGDWRPEQLWLSDQCRSLTARQSMAEAVAAASDAALSTADPASPHRELLTVFRYRGRHAAALRLKARILRGPRAQSTPTGRDLAASALWLAVMQHDDLLAAIEFAAEVTGRAGFLELEAETGEALPPGMHSVRQLASRMRRRGHEALAHRVSSPVLDTIGSCLARALAEDPLRTPSGRFDWGGADWGVA